MVFKYSYNFTEKAETDLEEILQYIGEELCNVTAAANLAKKIFACIDEIRVFPETGKLVENEYLQDKSIRRVLIDNYTLYYKVEEADKIIYIVRLVYGKRNMNEVLQQI